MALLLAFVGALLLLSAGLIVRANRRRGVKWVKEHVSVTALPGPSATFETQPGDGSNRDHVITVVPVEVERSTSLEENRS